MNANIAKALVDLKLFGPATMTARIVYKLTANPSAYTFFVRQMKKRNNVYAKTSEECAQILKKWWQIVGGGAARP